MSLRIFHIIFVTASIALCLFVALWCVREYQASGSAANLALGVVFLLSGAALVVYGKKVFHKLKELP
jgi:hypothetical protein